MLSLPLLILRKRPKLRFEPGHRAAVPAIPYKYTEWGSLSLLMDFALVFIIAVAVAVAVAVAFTITVTVRLSLDRFFRQKSGLVNITRILSALGIRRQNFRLNSRLPAVPV